VSGNFPENPASEKSGNFFRTSGFFQEIPQKKPEILSGSFWKFFF